MLDPSFYINITELIVCFVFTIFLIIVYLSKKNINNIENKVYKNIMIWTLLNLIVSVLLSLLLIYSNIEVVKFVNKFFYITVVSWIYFLMFYLIVVTNEHRDKFYNFISKNFNYCLIGSYLFLAFIYSFFFMMGYDTFTVKNGVISDIGGFIYTYYSSIMLVFAVIALFSTIVNFKETSKKKLIPFFLMLPIGLVVLALGLLLPNVAMVQCLYTLVCYLMYHTIENPDVKMLNELELAKNALEKSNNAKSDFLSSMSHEIRTPLNAIVGLSQMIEYGDNMEDMKKDSKDIIVASNNLLEIVNGILDISKLEENKMEMIEDSYNPIEVFEDIAKLNINRIGSKEIELRCNYSPNLPRELYGDKEKLRQIINNLLSNAIKYTEKGYVDFIVECTNERDRSILKIMVSDTGRGIAPEEMDNLFTKFYRLKEDMDSDIGGTGLGLAITKSLVELFNGKIEVDSTVGVGSKFTVTLSQQLTTTVHQKPVYNIDDMKNNEIEVM